MERVLARRYGDVDTGLEKIAEKFIELHESDDGVNVCKDIADRFDGKPAQAIVGPDNGPIQVMETPWLPVRSR